MIKFRCSKCGKKIGVDEVISGKHVRCPECKHVEKVPETTQPKTKPKPSTKLLGDIMEDHVDVDEESHSTHIPLKPPHTSEVMIVRDCPNCGQEIPEAAAKCEFCGALTLNSSSPIASASMRQRRQKQKSLTNRPKKRKSETMNTNIGKSQCGVPNYMFIRIYALTLLVCGVISFIASIIFLILSSDSIQVNGENGSVSDLLNTSYKFIALYFFVSGFGLCFISQIVSAYRDIAINSWFWRQ